MFAVCTHQAAAAVSVTAFVATGETTLVVGKQQQHKFQGRQSNHVAKEPRETIPKLVGKFPFHTECPPSVQQALNRT